MSSIQEVIASNELSVLEAELPRRRWSGKRLVGACALVAALAGGVYAASEIADSVSAAAAPQYVEVPSLTVELRPNAGARHYLKVRVTLEAPSADDAAALRTHLPAVIDGFQSFLRELRPEDLAGAGGSYRIKEELLVRVNRAAHPARASDVLIQELIQQ